MSDHFGTEGVVIPDVPEPIKGYRAFRWSDERQRLVGFGDAEWPNDGPLRAEHRGHRRSMFMSTAERPAVPCVECPSPGAAGHTGYGCGIYAYSDLQSVARHSASDAIWAEVELWGKVYEHAKGYRAEYGRVAGIYRVPSTPDARAAAETYDVPLLDLPYTQAEVNKLRSPAEFRLGSSLTPAQHAAVARAITSTLAGSISGDLGTVDPKSRRRRLSNTWHWINIGLQTAIGLGFALAFHVIPWGSIVIGGGFLAAIGVRKVRGRRG